MSPRVLVVIPARLASTRLAEKPLLKETGKFLIQHVYERAARVAGADEIVVATDHESIKSAVRSFGGLVEMTSPDHASGSDRVAEVARRRDAEIVINLQGDEPEFDPADVGALVAVLKAEPEVEMGTLVFDGLDDVAQADPAVVKAVLEGDWAVDFRRGPAPGAMLHLGIYAYRNAFLQAFTALEPTPRERERHLEKA